MKLIIKINLILIYLILLEFNDQQKKKLLLKAFKEYYQLQFKFQKLANKNYKN